MSPWRGAYQCIVMAAFAQFKTTYKMPFSFVVTAATYKGELMFE